jgi:hypothetical protein
VGQDIEQLKNVTKQLKDLAHEVASELRTTLSTVIFDDGRLVGCTDHHMLTISLGEKATSIKIHHNEILTIKANSESMLQNNIRKAVYRLKRMTEY